MLIIQLLLFSFIAKSTQTEICVTPIQQKGYCKSILNCPFLKGLATKTDITRKDVYFLRQSACGFEDSIPKVCCPVDDRSPCTSTDAPPDPWSGCCGRAVGERYRKGTFTPAIDQYPWMALVEYDKGNQTKLLCSATLISGRYLLSTAHCFNDAVHGYGEPKRVRLGEFNTANNGPDCVKNQGILNCNDGAITVTLERAVVHPRYDRKSKLNDISIVRLSERVKYTDFIRPICLPSKDITVAPPSYFPLQAAGWGTTTEGVQSEVLKHVGLPYVKPEICKHHYSIRNIKIENSHICAGKSGRDTCKGDTGGPLMYEAGLFTEALGITSFGPTPCGTNVPGVYTKVFTYVQWIRQAIELWDLRFPPSEAPKFVIKLPLMMPTGTFTPAIDQYPWMALVEYDKGNQTKLLCSATLISGRYLLSTAHCFNDAVHGYGEPKRVRLGEFNTANNGPDCVKNQGILNCNDGAITVTLERAVVHPRYDRKSKLNDISIVRLSERVKYTDFIRPICLPSKDITVAPPSYFPLQAAGWGTTTEGVQSEVLKHVGLPYVKPEICKHHYSIRNIKIENSHICAGKSGRDTCKGDTGGPLMYEAGLFTEALGITSFGPTPCGTNVPGVYTKVFTYVQWIRQAIELWDLRFPPSEAPK